MSNGSPRAYEAMLRQGYDELRQGEFDKAMETFTACLVIMPKEAGALRGQAFAQQQLKNGKTNFKKAAADVPTRECRAAIKKRRREK